MDPRRDLSLSCRESEGSWEVGLTLVDEETQFLFYPSTKLNCGDLSVQLSRVRLSATPRTAAHQASLSITNSRSPPKPMSIESVMPSSHLILCRPLLFPPSVFLSITVFSNEFQFFTSGGQTIGVAASTSVLPVNTQD